MAWSVHTWIILRIFQSQFLSGKVSDEKRHSPYTKRWGAFWQTVRIKQFPLSISKKLIIFVSKWIQFLNDNYRKNI